MTGTRPLSPKPKKRRFFGLADLVTKKPETERTPIRLDPDKRDPEELRAAIKADRVRRRMTWPVYAEFLGLSVSTIYKIATGVHTPTEITESVIREKLNASPAE